MSRILSAFSITDTPVASQPRAIPNVVSIAGIDPTRRGETLTIDEFVALARALDEVFAS